jgi:hypothetical protein
METSELQRRQLIEHLLTQHAQMKAADAVNLWEPMAAQIVGIGEGGFNSLYARSLFLSQNTFPWLAACALSAQEARRFVQLQTCFESQTSAQVRAANAHLLITFTNILAGLIGDQLTTRILRSAWSNTVPDSINQEFKDE